MHGRTSADVVVTALPAPHAYGNVVINGTFLVGGTVVLMERFSASQALRLIDAHRATAHHTKWRPAATLGTRSPVVRDTASLVRRKS